LKTLRIATRGSKLALWQAERTRDILLSLQDGLEIEIVPIKSEGDEWQTQRIQDLGTVGIFTREIERALLDGRADVAVHSLKDLPTETPSELVLGALLPRDDPRDALVARSLVGFDDQESRVVLSALPRSARIGTSSLRRQAQLLRQRPDLNVVEIRGNVPTRLAKVEDGEIDGIMLSAAGLDRLGLHPQGCVRLDPQTMLPAPAQGTIAVQVRVDDKDTHALVRRADDRGTRLTTTTERLLLHALQGGCRVPLGALARLEAEHMHLQARLLSVDGKRVLESSHTGPANNPRALASAVAEELLSRGAREILASLRADPS
jgi:hydroxymethylbilane synthase